MRNIRILLADDHSVVRNGIKLMLSQQKVFIPEIEEAGDSREVIELAMKKPFDIILMDISLPEQNGIAVTKYLMKKNHL